MECPPGKGYRLCIAASASGRIIRPCVLFRQAATNSSGGTGEVVVVVAEAEVEDVFASGNKYLWPVILNRI